MITVWIKKLDDDDVFAMTTGTYTPVYQGLTKSKTQEKPEKKKKTRKEIHDNRIRVKTP